MDPYTTIQLLCGPLHIAIKFVLLLTEGFMYFICLLHCSACVGTQILFEGNSLLPKPKEKQASNQLFEIQELLCLP